MTPEARAQIEGTIAQLQALLDADCDCPEVSPITVAELWARYVETLPSDQHWVASAVSMLKPILATIGDMQVSKLKIAHVEDYRDRPDIKERFKASSLNLQIQRLRACFNWAVDSGRILSNPLRRLRPLRRAPKRETEISHEGEAAALARMEEWMQALFLVAIDSAMRREEIRLLEWTDIDWAERKIKIPAARTKTKKERIGRLTERAAAAVKARPRVPGCPWVFTNPKTKKPYSCTAIWSKWRAAADGAKLQAAPGDGAVHLHDSRASAASRLVRAGATMPAIQAILGHSNLTTTAGYVRVQSKDVDAAHALLEAHLILAAAQRKGPKRARTSPDRGAKVSPAPPISKAI